MCKNAEMELTQSKVVASSRTIDGGAADTLLKASQVKEIYEMKGADGSIRGIAKELDVSRNTVRKYLKSPDAMRPKATAKAVIQAGSVRGLHRPTNGGGVGKLCGAAPGATRAGL